LCTAVEIRFPERCHEDVLSFFRTRLDVSPECSDCPILELAFGQNLEVREPALHVLPGSGGGVFSCVRQPDEPCPPIRLCHAESFKFGECTVEPICFPIQALGERSPSNRDTTGNRRRLGASEEI